MALYLPRRWRQQPQSPVEVDYANPFGARAGAIILPGRGAPYDLVGRQFGSGGTIDNRITPAGRAVRYQDATHKLYVKSATGIDTNDSVTVLSLGRFWASDGGLIGLRGGNGYGWSFGTGNWSADQSKLGVGGSWRGNLAGQSSLFDVTHGIQTFAGTWSVSGGNFAAEFFVDGKSVGTSGVATDPDVVGASPYLYAYFLQAEASRPEHNLILVLRGQSDAAAIRELSDNPWQVIRRRTPLIISLPAAGGSTYNDTLTETATVDATLANSATFASSLIETATVADSHASVQTMPASLSDAVTVADAYAPALTISVALVESTTLGDSVANGTVYNDALSESVTPADVYSAVVTISATVTESVTAADAYASVAVMAAAITEAFTPADAFGVGAIFPATLGESTTLGDSYPDEHSQPGVDAITEDVSVADDYAAQATFADDLVESASLGDAFTVELAIQVAAAEAVTLADAYESARIVTADLEESVAVAESVAAVLQAITTLAEDVALGDSLLGTVSGMLSVDLPHTRRIGPRTMKFGTTRVGARTMSFGTTRIGQRRMQFGVRRIGPRTLKGD